MFDAGTAKSATTNAYVANVRVPVEEPFVQLWNPDK